MLNNELYEYMGVLSKHYKCNEILVYGSVIEVLNGISNVQYRDIDIVMLGDHFEEIELLPGNSLNPFDVPVHIEVTKYSSLIKELEKLEPKFFQCVYIGQQMNDISKYFGSASLSHVRHCISAVSSRAFDKGKKKLILEDDFDVVLGLKNIHHSFKFLEYAKSYYIKDYKLQVQFLQELRTEIDEIYFGSTGTLQEKCDELMKTIKPKYNSAMTDFRKYFPKEANNG